MYLLVSLRYLFNGSHLLCLVATSADQEIQCMALHTAADQGPSTMSLPPPVVTRLLSGIASASNDVPCALQRCMPVGRPDSNRTVAPHIAVLLHTCTR